MSTTTSQALVSINKLRNHLNQMFPERQSQVEGILMALLASEHAVFLGPPGGAKSAMVRHAARAFGYKVFETLLARFTKPPEVFGLISLKGIENDEVIYKTKGMLPDADVAILDEIFKAGTALLNSLLAAINERTFFNGTLGPQKIPLRSVFGASNEMPQGEGLDALWDRFLFRYDTKYLVAKDNFVNMASAPDAEPVQMFDGAVLTQAGEEAMATVVGKRFYEAMFDLRGALLQENVILSDRRWKKVVKAAKAAAYLAGESEADPADFLQLEACLWNEAKQRPIVSKVLYATLDTTLSAMNELLQSSKEEVNRFNASAKGIKESTAYGKTLRAIKDKAHKGLSNAGPRNKPRLEGMYREIENNWKIVIKQAADAVGASV